MKNTILVIAAAGVIGTVAYGGYWFGMNRSMQSAAPTADDKTASTKAGTVRGTDLIDPVTGRKALYWHDPMVPGQKFDKPGKSPFMDMQLVPVYADSAGEEGSVSISSRMQQNLGVRTAEVTRGSETFLLTENQSTFIPLGETHRLHNPGKTAVEIIEIQSGSYLGEDDIVRFDDVYGRVVPISGSKKLA